MKKLFFSFILLLFLGSINAQNHKPVAVNDTVYTYFGDTVYINPLANDYDPDGDTIKIHIFNDFEKVNDTSWYKIVTKELNENPFLDDTLNFRYLIRDGHMGFDQADVVLIVHETLSGTFIDVNNLRALISPVGQHFWNFETRQFEAPKGSGKSPIFNSTMWMACKQGTVYHVAAEKYKQVGWDYFQGPIRLDEDSVEMAKWLPGTWKLNQSDIDFHKTNWDKNGYVPNEVILNWPANGDPANGQMEIYAPFFDRNNNGKYEPMNGDFPLIRGDQSVFFIMNDSMHIHTESYGAKIGVEILGTAYEFNRLDDPVLSNTLFMHYDIINRSDNNYDSVYLGLFFDFDLGDANDDYFGTDVTNGMIYGYNGDDVDGTGQSWAYGNNPPAIGLKIIGGPFLPADGIDNPEGECSFDINGLNFGDGIADNERYGMTNSTHFFQFPFQMWEYPSIAPEYYNFMSGLWKDEIHFSFGGNSHPDVGSAGPDCNFIFPDKSDTLCNWGTEGVMPNGGYNQNGYFWNEITTGNVPGDRRGLASIGPFSMKSGESIPLDFCYIFVQADGGAIASRDSLIKAAGYIQNNEREIIAFTAPPYGKKEIPVQGNFKVFPNPAKDRIVVFCENKNPQEYRIYNLTGSLVQTGLLVQGNNQLDISAFKPGLYLIKSGEVSAKIIVQ